MKQKDLTKTIMMNSNWKHLYSPWFIRFKGKFAQTCDSVIIMCYSLFQAIAIMDAAEGCVF